jgi:hypothetical protein
MGVFSQFLLQITCIKLNLSLTACSVHIQKLSLYLSTVFVLMNMTKHADFLNFENALFILCKLNIVKVFENM